MLSIEATINTPSVVFNSETGVLDLEGRSFSQSAYFFFKQLITEMAEYIKQPCPQTTLNVKLEYFNTDSIKGIMEILLMMKSIKESSEVTVNWYYEEEDDDMREAGEDFQMVTHLNFNLIETEIKLR